MTGMENTVLKAVPEEADDVSLTRPVLAGDSAAFELLMRCHNRPLYRLARSMLRNAADAEDALQEAYLSAFKSMAGFRGDSSLATWLSRLVVSFRSTACVATGSLPGCCPGLANPAEPSGRDRRQGESRRLVRPNCRTPSPSDENLNDSRSSR